MLEVERLRRKANQSKGRAYCPPPGDCALMLYAEGIEPPPVCGQPSGREPISETDLA
jgi:hypothetical protein